MGDLPSCALLMIPELYWGMMTLIPGLRLNGRRLYPRRRMGTSVQPSTVTGQSHVPAQNTNLISICHVVNVTV